MLDISTSHYRSRLRSRDRAGHILWALVPFVVSFAPLLAFALFVAFAAPNKIDDDPSIASEVMVIGP